MSRQLPEQLQSRRFLLRLPTAADAEELNRAIVTSHEQLKDWLPWAGTPQTLTQTQEFCEKAHQRWAAGEGLDLVIELNDSAELAGGCGFPRLDWEVPRFEIGYWIRSNLAGRGLISEATMLLARHALIELTAARVELFIDDRNERSCRVAERLGFALEGLLHNDSRTSQGQLRNTRVYAVTDLESLTEQPYPALQPR